MYRLCGQGSVIISTKSKESISTKSKEPISIEFYNQKESQTTAKLLMKLLCEEIARQIYNKKNNYEVLVTSDEKKEGRNIL